jgi:hypothetical protein
VHHYFLRWHFMQRAGRWPHPRAIPCRHLARAARALHGCCRAASFAATAAAPKPWSLAASGSSPPEAFQKFEPMPFSSAENFLRSPQIEFFFFFWQKLFIALFTFLSYDPARRIHSRQLARAKGPFRGHVLYGFCDL